MAGRGRGRVSSVSALRTESEVASAARRGASHRLRRAQPCGLPGRGSPRRIGQSPCSTRGDPWKGVAGTDGHDPRGDPWRAGGLAGPLRQRELVAKWQGTDTESRPHGRQGAPQRQAARGGACPGSVALSRGDIRTRKASAPRPNSFPPRPAGTGMGRSRTIKNAARKRKNPQGRQRLEAGRLRSGGGGGGLSGPRSGTRGSRKEPLSIRRKPELN